MTYAPQDNLSGKAYLEQASVEVVREASLASGLVELMRACNVRTEDEFDDLVYAVVEGLQQYLPEFEPSENAISVARGQVERTTGFLVCEQSVEITPSAEPNNRDLRKAAPAPGRVPC